MINCYISNDLDRLKDRLLSHLNEADSSPLTQEYIAVQSQDMAHWLRMRIAERNGICMNMQFPFPQKMVMQLLESFASDKHPLPDQNAYTKAVSLWTIYHELKRIISDDAKNPTFRNNVIRYIAKGQPGEGRRTYQLASKLSELLDNYRLYRPQMILAWENGHFKESEAWQAHFWRRVCQANNNATHLASFCRNLSIDKNAAPSPKISRVSFFAINQIPPLYLEALKLFDERAGTDNVEINFYALQPTSYFWGDLKSKRDLAKSKDRFEQRAREAIYPDSSLQLTCRSETADHSLGSILYDESVINNPLLGSMGQIGQDFHNLIIDSGIHCSDGLFVENDKDPASCSMLELLQDDIYRLIDRNARSEHKPIPRTQSKDRSIEIHSCYSPMREVEALYDSLLSLFEQNPSVTPEDIVVMAPDINTYAPYIHAVFAAPENERTRINYTVSDRSERANLPVIDAFMDILALCTGRFKAGELIAFIENPVTKEAFNLSEEEIRLIRVWLKDSGYRWGVDEAHKESVSGLRTSANSLTATLDRLMMGYAFKDGINSNVQGIFPYAHIEGGCSGTLGKFMDISKKLIAIHYELKLVKNMESWAESMNEIIRFFFERNETHTAQSAMIEKEVAILREHADRASITFDAQTLIEHFENAFAVSMHRSRFMSGGVNFCSMLPMRSIPFKVVCLIGMNDRDFPRSVHSSGMDLMSHSRHLGDRNRKDDDKYIFLETLLAAREKLYISYVGQSPENLKHSPPSVLVSGLIDCLDNSFIFETNKDEKFETTMHRLQPFHPAYYADNSKLHSYSAEYFHIAKSLLLEKTSVLPDRQARLPNPNIRNEIIDINELISFYQNPCKYFATHTLSLRFPDDDELLKDTEAFEIDGLNKYEIKNRLLSANNTDTSLHQLFLYDGALPPGHAGEINYDTQANAVKQYKKLLEELKDGHEESPAYIGKENGFVQIGDFKVGGVITGIHGLRLIEAGLSGIRCKHKISALIKRSIWTFENQPEYADGLCVDMVGIKDKVLRETLKGRPLNEEELISLLEAFEMGQMQPHMFFPETSYAWRDAFGKNHSESEAASAALKEWDPYQENSFPESQDPYIKMFFEDPDFYSSAFHRNARLLYDPLFQNIDS